MSQWLTLDNTWIDLGSSLICAGLTYVAISLVRKLEDLLVESMTLERLQAINKSENFQYQRLEETIPDFLNLKLQKLFQINNVFVFVWVVFFVWVFI